MLIARQVGQLRQLRQGRLHQGCPTIELDKIDVGQRVLILGRCQPAADVHILHGLHEQPDADNTVHGGIDAGHDLIDRRTLPLGLRAMKSRPWFSVEVAPPAPI